MERAAGSLDSAAIAFERYLLTGPSRALGLLELARTRLALGRADGDGPYYEGAALDDPEATAGYRADQLVAADSVLRELDRLKGQMRAAYLHRFWTDRDHLELRPEGERLRSITAGWSSPAAIFPSVSAAGFTAAKMPTGQATPRSTIAG